MLNGSNMDGMRVDSIKQIDIEILAILMDNILNMNNGLKQDYIDVVFPYKWKRNGRYDSWIDPYIIDTFRLFCGKKKTLVINLDYVERFFSKICDFVVDGVDKQHDVSFSDNPFDNLFRPELFRLFVNVEKIFMYTTTNTGELNYKFKLKSFIWLLDGTDSVKQVDIMATIMNSKKFATSYSSWIHYIWTEEIDKYKSWLENENWELMFETKQGKQKKKADCLMIRKKIQFDAVSADKSDNQEETPLVLYDFKHNNLE